MSPTAVVLLNRYADDGATLLSVSVDDQMVKEFWSHTADENEARMAMVDEFWDLWDEHVAASSCVPTTMHSSSAICAKSWAWGLWTVHLNHGWCLRSS